MKKIIKRIIIAFVCLYLVIVSYNIYILIPMLTLSFEEYQEEIYNQVLIRDLFPNIPNIIEKREAYIVMKCRYDNEIISKTQLIGLAFLIPLPPYKTS